MTPAVDLARAAFETATSKRLVAHIVTCNTVARIAGPEGREAAEDAIAYDPDGAAAAAWRELEQLDESTTDAIISQARQKVSETMLLTANALVCAYTVLGGDQESARGLDPEHVALAGALALLTGADELYVPPHEA